MNVLKAVATVGAVEHAAIKPRFHDLLLHLISVYCRRLYLGYTYKGGNKAVHKKEVYNMRA